MAVIGKKEEEDRWRERIEVTVPEWRQLLERLGQSPNKDGGFTVFSFMGRCKTFEESEKKKQEYTSKLDQLVYAGLMQRSNWGESMPYYKPIGERKHHSRGSSSSEEAGKKQEKKREEVFYDESCGMIVSSHSSEHRAGEYLMRAFMKHERCWKSVGELCGPAVSANVVCKLEWLADYMASCEQLMFKKDGTGKGSRKYMYVKPLNGVAAAATAANPDPPLQDEASIVYEMLDKLRLQWVAAQNPQKKRRIPVQDELATIYHEHRSVSYRSVPR